MALRAVCEGSTCMSKQLHAGACICMAIHFYVSACKHLLFFLFSGLSPLHLAVLRGHKDLARMLLNAGANINAMVGPGDALTRH